MYKYIKLQFGLLSHNLVHFIKRLLDMVKSNISCCVIVLNICLNIIYIKKKKERKSVITCNLRVKLIFAYIYI